MVDQRLIQTTPPAATPDELWPRVAAAWSSDPKNTSKVSLNQYRGVYQRGILRAYETEGTGFTPTDKSTTSLVTLSLNYGTLSWCPLPAARAIKSR
ncbi:hypothetical protein TNCV_4119211 [Trichonephila clavipes]|nr:hypothetical protein TNCV_4119211 [Trichonephila clavipes]